MAIRWSDEARASIMQEIEARLRERRRQGQPSGPSHYKTPAEWHNDIPKAAAPSLEAMVATAKRIQSYLYGSWDLSANHGDLEPGDPAWPARVALAVERIKALCPEPKCTCGVQHTGGIHSDWCDLDREND